MRSSLSLVVGAVPDVLHQRPGHVAVPAGPAGGGETTRTVTQSIMYPHCTH